MNTTIADNSVSESADVSVVIPTYNSAETLDNALRSIFIQTIKIRDVFVIDDASNEHNLDMTREVIERWMDFGLDIKFIANAENMGAAYSRNVGMRLAESEYIAFLDSDDVWHPEKIRMQYEIMERCCANMCGHRYIPDLTLKNFLAVDSRAIKYKPVQMLRFVLGNPFATPTVMLRRRNSKIFPEDLKRAEDYYCWIANYQQGKVLLINENLAGGSKFSYGIGGLSENVAEMHKSIMLCFKLLYINRKVSLLFLYIASLVEQIKYIIRLIQVRRNSKQTTDQV